MINELQLRYAKINGWVLEEDGFTLRKNDVYMQPYKGKWLLKNRIEDEGEGFWVWYRVEEDFQNAIDKNS